MRERYERFFELAPIGMAVVALDGTWLEVNRALGDITGYDPAALCGMTFLDLTHPDDVELTPLGRGRLLARESASFQIEKRYLRRDGAIVWVQVTTSLVRDADDDPLYYLAQIQDISDRKRVEEQLRELAARDELTELFNRRRFEEELVRANDFAARYRRPSVLLVIDVDGFKAVNDAHGHAAGDDVLRRIARILEQRLRRTDIVARVGGDEFAALLPETDLHRGRHVGAAVVAAVGRAMAEGEPAVTVSAGLTVLEGGGDTVETVLRNADNAMYDAKREGGNRLRIHTG